LLKDYSDVKGDMTRPINTLLAGQNTPRYCKLPDTEMDRGADFVSFDGNPDVVLCLNLTLALELSYIVIPLELRLKYKMLLLETG
jgi:hypothetical protein